MNQTAHLATYNSIGSNFASNGIAHRGTRVFCLAAGDSQSPVLWLTAHEYHADL